jgi:molybdopterin-containing oxidoreductase family membrane subunit
MALAVDRSSGRRESRSLSFAAFIAVLAIVIAWSLVAWVYQLANGLAVTGMRDVMLWGSYIFTFAFLIGLSAGGLIVASGAEVFGIASLKPLSRLGVLTAGACVLVAAATIIPDLGRPDRVGNLILHPNWTSPLVWDVTIIAAYFLISAIDLWLLTRPPRLPWPVGRALTVMAFIGLPAAVLLHSITAWIFGLQVARPWWNTALLAPLFVVSAILSGTALIMLIALAAKRFDRLQLPVATWKALSNLIAATLAIDLFLVGADYLTIYWGNVPREMATLALVLPGGSWQWIFWLEWAVGGLLPFLLLVLPWTRLRPGFLAAAAGLVLVGVYAFRIELVSTGLVTPLIQLPPGISLGTYTPGQVPYMLQGVYFPTWVEVSIVFGLAAALALFVTLGYRWLHVMRPASAEETGGAG